MLLNVNFKIQLADKITICSRTLIVDINYVVVGDQSTDC